ncbi:hypothetical protein PF005_g6953 [Phytophthora fragariae]|uniref:Uncharacterized protein n=1 Tax=Phytophthora fragariae TaxID=53985 RepID=A0A6A3UH19_9STRA|nr:hypothetical protein PF003_g26566 [Phytophthora fragariae]KAE8947618.1 hypothetical protein PF009_g2772 [Phytophthora fragariae]KAE9002734.1 hypothetical protein PF011_g13188 [Phytophthora fragariae]KAE9122553.1 hypothetical protein PF007_g7409 [Phytophthora fragariae]KAE9126836.1 hypothetical protein PF010_g5124 [Phytophthora fragariae]
MRVGDQGSFIGDLDYVFLARLHISDISGVTHVEGCT